MHGDSSLGKAQQLNILTILLFLSRPVLSPGADMEPHYAHHLAAMPKIEGFTAIVERPFVVLGDEAPEVVQRRAAKTVRWAVAKLKQDYFERDPNEIIDVWLFKDHHSYTNHAWALFHDHPTSPFGYFSEKDHALVMDISTGGGTLVHEMVHAFLRANFAKCPVWFNEGFASLFEASSERDGHIVGLVNWRFKGLEKAIKEKRTIPFKQLTAKTGAEFYNGTNYGEFYAQARYLCYYLQEQGLLITFYREFRKNVKNDPTGYETLSRVLGETDMDLFKKKWEKFMLGLRGN
jgi:hypothetical protein